MSLNGFSQESLVYFGTYTGAKSKGITFPSLIWRPQLSAPELAAEITNPTFITVAPGEHFLYAVSEVDEIGGKRTGAVDAFAVDSKTGKLTPLNQQLFRWQRAVSYLSGRHGQMPAGRELRRRQHRRAARFTPMAALAKSQPFSSTPVRA